MPALAIQKRLPVVSDNNCPKRYTSNLGESHMKIVLNFLYYFCLCPFKVVSNSHGQYIIKYNKLHRIVCVLMHIVGIFLSILFIARVLQNGIITTTPNIALMLDVIGNTAAGTGALCLVAALWSDHANILYFLEATRVKKTVSKKCGLSANWPVRHPLIFCAKIFDYMRLIYHLDCLLYRSMLSACTLLYSI